MTRAALAVCLVVAVTGVVLAVAWWTLRAPHATHDPVTPALFLALFQVVQRPAKRSGERLRPVPEREPSERSGRAAPPHDDPVHP